MLRANKSSSLVIHNAVEMYEEVSTEANGKGRKFVSRFIEAGLAHYEQFGDVLITKETLDKFIHTLIGCPVIIKHKDITDKNADQERVGVISNVWFNDLDGWFYCDGIIWDKQAIDLVKNQGWNVSCTYDFESDFVKGTYHGKPYDMEFTGGKFLHLALVPNPRYERATIVMNSRDDSESRFLQGLRTIVENASAQDLTHEDFVFLEGLDKLLCVDNADRWITIGADEEEGRKGTHLLIKDGETFKQAIRRKVREYKRKQTQSKPTRTKKQANTQRESRKTNTKRKELKTVAGVERSAPMSHDEADHGRVNPNYSRWIHNAYHRNCQSCVVCYELRRRGFDVQAQPRVDSGYMADLSRNSALAYIDPKTGGHPWRHYSTAKDPDEMYDWLDREIQEGRYEFRMVWSGQSHGHIINAFRDNGTLVLYDPQTNKTYRTREDMKDKLFNKFDYSMPFGVFTNQYVLRVDNLELNKKILDSIVEPS